MAEEVQQQSEVATQTSAPEAPQEPTLDDVYKTYNIEETAQSFSAKQPEQQPHPQQQPTQQPVQDQNIPIPDPTLDPAGYKAWESARYKDQMALRQALSGIAGEIQKERIARAKAEEEADIRNAVESVNKHLGDSKLDPDVVEISLGAEARRDKRFMALWNNRHANPKAFNEGIKAFATKLSKKFSMRVDPQIAENQRALKEATSTKATTAPEETERDRIGKLNGAEFEREWARLRGGY
jgi:hypothetical protein